MRERFRLRRTRCHVDGGITDSAGVEFNFLKLVLNHFCRFEDVANYTEIE